MLLSCFNPRPSSLRGATPYTQGQLEQIEFQSSPLIAEGRYKAWFEDKNIEIPFQSSPLIAEGRYSGCAAMNRLVNEFQSSPLIAEGRYARNGIAT